MDRLRLEVAVVGLAMLLAGCARGVGDADVDRTPAAASTPAQTLMWEDQPAVVLPKPGVGRTASMIANTGFR